MSGQESKIDLEFHDELSTDRAPTTSKAARSPASARGRPKGLTVICALAIILAGGGLVMECFLLVFQVLGPHVQQALAATSDATNQPVVRVVFPLLGLTMVVEAALLAGAIMAFALKLRF